MHFSNGSNIASKSNLIFKIAAYHPDHKKSLLYFILKNGFTLK
jgi:hypothetical protein